MHSREEAADPNYELPRRDHRILTPKRDPEQHEGKQPARDALR